MPPHPSTRDRTPAAGVSLGGGMPLQWKLPLLMVALLAAALLAMLGFTYVTLTQRAAGIVSDRLASASDEVAGTAEESLDARVQAIQEVARDPAVLRLLASARAARPPASGDVIAARAALRRLAPRSEWNAPLELWDARRHVLASAGPPLPRLERRGLPDLVTGAADSVRFGPLHEDEGRVRFWTVVPIVQSGVRMGYVAQVRFVGGPRDATQTLRDLLGEEVRMFTRNADGGFWSTASGEPADAPLRADTGESGTWYVRQGAGRSLVGEAPIDGTPWVLVLETPEASVLRRPRSTARALALVGVMITLAGAALAWVAGRRLARPLLTLTSAAESLAAGSYARPVSGGGRDEIGRLAASFDAMARQVAAARRALEDRVDEAQRARADAEQARAEAELANRAKSDFLAVMSHELRTPLNAIGGYAQLLEMGIHGPVTEAQREVLGRIERSQAHLLTLINDVLNFARIDAGQVQYVVTDVRVADALADVEALVSPQVQAAGLRFRVAPCAGDLRIRADRDKLRQVLINLLGNAIKYTAPGGEVAVECEPGEDGIRLHVRDTGTGIRAERLAHIFEPFVQGDRALNRPDEGVGLGLAISRELARGMGGELEVRSELGIGSVFTVLLPRAEAPHAVPIDQAVLPGHAVPART